MKRQLTKLLLAILFLPYIGIAQIDSQAQRRNNNWSFIDTVGIASKDSISREGYTIIFINKDAGFSSVTKQRMIDAFFTVYPAEVKRFNQNAVKKVTFVIDSAYKGIAAAANGIVRVNPKWMKDHPNDIDIVTHEVMHIVQSYGRGSGGPGWLTEGIADYVRYKYGIANSSANWSLPKYDTSHSYTRSYRVTARFLAWLENKVHPTIVDELDASLRSHTYSPELWQKLTGKTLDELWKMYAEQPVL